MCANFNYHFQYLGQVPDAAPAGPEPENQVDHIITN